MRYCDDEHIADCFADVLWRIGIASWDMHGELQWWSRELRDD